MKFLSTQVCGLLLSGALLAASGFAQSSATSGGTAGKTQSQPSTPAQGSPSNRPISALTPGTPAPPAHPITIEQTRQLLALMDYKKIEDSNWSQMITMNRQAAPFIPEDVWTDVQTNINTIDYASLLEPIYAKYLSQEDAAKALEFYGTPAGKRVLQSMPPLLGESVAASQQKGRELGRQAIEKHKTEIEDAQKKYQAEHAPKTTPSLGPGGAAPTHPTSPSTAPAPATPPPSTAKPQR
jgi:uncharacterized protein